MSDLQVVDVFDLDLSKITFLEPRAIGTAKGSRTVGILYDKKRLILQTPRTRLPFGLQLSYGSDQENPKYVMEMSFGGQEKFLQKMKDFDNFLIEKCVKLSSEWLREDEVPVDFVKRVYSPNVKYSKDPQTNKPTDKYPPTMRVKVPYKNGSFLCSVYDEKREAVDLKNKELTELLTKGAYTETLTSCLGIWLVSGKFGCSWKVEQMKYSTAPRLQGYAFLDKNLEMNKIVDMKDDELNFTVEN